MYDIINGSGMYRSRDGRAIYDVLLPDQCESMFGGRSVLFAPTNDLPEVRFGNYQHGSRARALQNAARVIVETVPVRQWGQAVRIVRVCDEEGLGCCLSVCTPGTDLTPEEN